MGGIRQELRCRTRGDAAVRMTAPAALASRLDEQAIELPFWAFGNSGTRFKVFAQAEVARNVFVFEKNVYNFP